MRLYVAQPTLGLVSGTLSGSFNNGRIICRFQRLRSVDKTSNKTGRYPRETASDTVFSLDDNSYYILLAKGDTSGGWLRIHVHSLCILSASVEYSHQTIIVSV